jgi:choline transport protein
MIWGWAAVSVVSLCVGYAMAEMCSEYPVAGGQYSWVYILAPKSIRRQMSYLTGWFMIIGTLCYPLERFMVISFFIDLYDQVSWLWARRTTSWEQTSFSAK